MSLVDSVVLSLVLSVAVITGPGSVAASVPESTVVDQVQKLLPAEDKAKATCLWIVGSETEAVAMVRLHDGSAPVLFKLTIDEGSWRLSNVIGDDGLWKSSSLPLELGTAAPPEQVTKMRLNSLRRALMSYFQDMNAYPYVNDVGRLADGGGAVPFGLEPGFLPPGSLPVTDGWEHTLRYMPIGEPQRTKEGEKEMMWALGYRIVSAGPDGTFDTADDLCMENGRMLAKCEQ